MAHVACRRGNASSGVASGSKHPVPKSLHVVHSLHNPLGGSIHAALGVCRYLTRAGHVADVAATLEPGDDTSYLAEVYPEVRVRTFPRSFPRRYSNSGALLEWLSAHLHDYDIVELHSVFTGVALRSARQCRERKKPYLIRPHGSLDPFDLQKHARLKRIVGPPIIRPALESASAVLLTSEVEARRLVTFGAKVNKVVLPLPVSLPTSAGDGARFRREHSIPEGAFIVMFMSRIDYKKGLEFLIPALSDLQREFSDLWFVLAGSGDPAFMPSVDRWLGGPGIGSRTSRVGFLSGQDKSDALAAAGIFALPSLNENFGIVLIEAMHAGVPLLISEEVYIQKEIAGHGAGLVCRSETASISSVLRRMLDGTVDLAQMGGRGRDLVNQRYRPEAATDLLLATYNEVLASRPQP